MAVFDASVVFRWLVHDGLSEAAITARDRFRATAPKLLLVEVANALRTQVKLGRMTRERAIAHINGLSGEIHLEDQDGLLPHAFGLAVECDHAVYDCVYVAMALKTGRPLITADFKLARKFMDLPGLDIITLTQIAEQ